MGKRDLIENSKKLKIPNDIIFHHFSFSRSFPEMLDKVCSREYSIMSVEWLRKYWSNWEYGKDYKEFKIIKTTNISSEVLGRYIKSINLLY